MNKATYIEEGIDIDIEWLASFGISREDAARFIRYLLDIERD